LAVFPQISDKSTAIDQAIYVAIYNLSIVTNPQEPEKKLEDIVMLQIGRSHSKSFSYLLFQSDSTAAALAKANPGGVPFLQKAVPPMVVYKNYPIGHNTVVHRTMLSGPVFEYREPVTTINWRIQPDRKTILGYSCQKAVGTYRGRTYEAWFATDIPIQEGPYKFRGLPGLILEIRDTQNHYVFNAISVQTPQRGTPILFWDWETQNTTRNELRDLVRRFHTEPAKTAESLGIRVRWGGGSESITHPYNPIELE
jgi:GLPGLI family protein